MADIDGSENTPLVELIDIGKRYGVCDTAFYALHNINLKIYNKEFVAIMGPSGSGKSTCMNLIGALDTPTKGQYLFNGHHVEHFTQDERALLRRKYLGFVFQGFNLLARTSAVENVELPLLYRGESPSVRKEMAMEALEKVGLTECKEHTHSELSGGQQQRVAIARAIVTHPKLLLADEPTGSLDSHRSVEIMELLQQLNEEEHITVALVTHEPTMAEYAKRKIHFVDGNVASDTGHIQ